MSRPCSHRAWRKATLTLALLSGFSPLAEAGSLDNLIASLQVMVPGSWQQVSLNSFASVVPAAADRPLYASDPGRVIAAWSGFTWDSKRGDLLLFGGGHANYSGNEVYRWDGATQMWSRGSLPSDIVAGPNNIYTSKGGALDAPASAHTYDTTNYLAVADRMLVMGGADFNAGGAYKDGAGQRTGPYLWDPAKADPTRVGGATGTGVNPLTEGGNMWSNRAGEGSNFNSYGFNQLEGGSVATVEGGKDVVYFTAAVGGSSDKSLYRYVINDINNPSADSISKVGRYWGGLAPAGAAAYDADSKLFVTVGGGPARDTPSFAVWDLDNAGPSNDAVTITPVVSGGGVFKPSVYTGIDWNPELGKFLIWDGGGDVWALSAPEAGNTAGTWTLERMSDGASFATGQKPADEIANGVWGKWKYVAELNAYLALGDTAANAAAGNVWLYKPEGWTNPVPEPSTWMSLLAGLALLGVVAKRRC